MDAHHWGHISKLARHGERLVKATIPETLVMLKRLALSLCLLLGLAFTAAPANAQGSVGDTFSVDEIVDKGGEFFGSQARS